jgi:CRP-like cAMP-binding protein
LARLDDAVLAAMRPHLATVRLNRGDIINRTDDAVRKVYFPHTGILSCVVELAGGAALETAMTGRDGQYGGIAALDQNISLNLVIVQIAGDASVIDADRFRLLAFEHPSLRHQVMAYEQFFVAELQQTCACNAVHKVLARTCKWLLRIHKLFGEDLALTQEYLAEMMGVRAAPALPRSHQICRPPALSPTHADGSGSPMCRRCVRSPASATTQ